MRVRRLFGMAALGVAVVLLLAEAAQAGKPVRIHVECFHPALGLYERLGCASAGDTGVYFLLEWHSPKAGG